MTAFASHRVYDVWTRLIQDEELYEAMLAGRHAELPGRDLDAEAIAILDGFRAQPGTRWNIENLRFRTAAEVGDTVASYLPRTMKMLTRGDDDWRQDICFEYLAHHQWKAMGHMRLAECVRFAQYARTRIVKRRITPPHFGDVLTFELAVIEVLKATAGVPASAWPDARTVTEHELAGLQPRRGPAQVLVELAADLQPWIESGDPLRGGVGPGPITLLVYVTSLDEPHRIKLVSEGVRVVLEACTGDRTADAIAGDLEAEYDLPAQEVLRIIARMLGERILAA